MGLTAILHLHPNISLNYIHRSRKSWDGSGDNNDNFCYTLAKNPLYRRLQLYICYSDAEFDVESDFLSNLIQFHHLTDLRANNQVYSLLPWKAVQKRRKSSSLIWDHNFSTIPTWASTGLKRFQVKSQRLVRPKDNDSPNLAKLW